ncbi:hypothetical protein QCN29_32375 [Streptomyces sp. HNM0663]|uniref:Integral membrane protein n=1 Tax=Streptomyces chengmaiensis TaxID=3040919 RepID=A0ABT6HXP5_9ACTN|nr:hypothetical protein [Streptomyces chengmaiensis]MDH2393380.1 hypothetical protein [Streptomyces chengmaiensis]
MTADARAPQTPDPATASPRHAEQERRRTRRIEVWSIAWGLLALVIWGWFAFLMLVDYGPEFGNGPMCRGPLVGPSSEDVLCRDPLRQWPALLGILALASIATVTAAATTVYAKVLSRLARRDEPGVRPQG